MGAALGLLSGDSAIYLIFTLCGFIIMVCSTMFAVQIMAFVQGETPQALIGKVIAVMLTVSMCSQPLGNALYGFLFEACRGFEFAVILFSGTVSMIIGIGSRSIFRKIPKERSLS